jgi:hypothetical protein
MRARLMSSQQDCRDLLAQLLLATHVELREAVSYTARVPPTKVAQKGAPSDRKSPMELMTA